MHDVLFVGGFSKSLIGFRGPLLEALRRSSVEVVACAPENDIAVRKRLAVWGVSYEPVPLRRAGLNPLADRTYLLALRALIKREEPRVIFAYTHKPIIYSALAVRGLKSRPRVYAMITGLGFAFIDGGGFKKIVAGTVLRCLYRRASTHLAGIIFQNADDQELFRRLKLVRSETPQIIVRGSGIDLEQFSFAPLNGAANAETLRTEKLKNVSGPDDLSNELLSGRKSRNAELLVGAAPTRFLLIARLLGDKGIREYVEAARRIKAEYAKAEFHLIGPTDPNPAAVPLREVEAWHREGAIVYHGSQDDVRPFLRDCTVYVLPSYREGTPRTVLEAMATGRPVITTDAPGCRETVFFEKSETLTERGNAEMVAPLVRPGALAEGDVSGRPSGSESHKPETLKTNIKQGKNGFLVPVKSVDALVSAMRRFIDDRELAIRMGAEGRRLAEEHYDVHKVNAQIMEFMGLAPQSGGKGDTLKS